MSKSKGNVVNPLDIISKNGADILRLWVANTEYTSDVTISDDILKQNIEIYRRIRNSFRFMLGNLFDFDISKDKVVLTGMHHFISEVTQNYEYIVHKLYDEYKFQKIVKETNKLLIDLSGWYFDYAKDVLYCDSKDSPERRAIQTNIANILRVTLHAIAPILPTTAEEVNSHINFQDKRESIFLERQSYKPIEFDYKKPEVNFYVKYREKANKVLEKARKDQLIERNNEAILTIVIPEKERLVSEKIYAKYLMVAKVKFGLEWKVETFDSVKCNRCWNHLDSLNEEGLCPRCAEVIK